jgi:two-component system uhpT operon response regulator UhpA
VDITDGVRRSDASGVIRVAILDDLRLVVDGLMARLAHEAPQIAVVTTHVRWSDLLADPVLPVDVVVIDLHLADRIPIATKIRALSSMGSAAVVISRHADAVSINVAMTAGATAFVAKTDSAHDLVAAIHAAARSEPFLTRPSSAIAAMFGEITDPGLGRQEQRALVLYASGRSIREVAESMDTTDETVKSYIKRARRKYRQVGIDVGTKSLLRRHAIREGWLSAE